MHMLHDPAVPLIGTYIEKHCTCESADTYKNVPNSVVYKNPKQFDIYQYETRNISSRSSSSRSSSNILLH